MLERKLSFKGGIQGAEEAIKHHKCIFGGTNPYHSWARVLGALPVTDVASSYVDGTNQHSARGSGSSAAWRLLSAKWSFAWSFAWSGRAAFASFRVSVRKRELFIGSSCVFVYIRDGERDRQRDVHRERACTCFASFCANAHLHTYTHRHTHIHTHRVKAVHRGSLTAPCCATSLCVYGTFVVCMHGHLCVHIHMYMCACAHIYTNLHTRAYFAYTIHPDLWPVSQICMHLRDV